MSKGVFVEAMNKIGETQISKTRKGSERRQIESEVKQVSKER